MTTENEDLDTPELETDEVTQDTETLDPSHAEAPESTDVDTGDAEDDSAGDGAEGQPEEPDDSASPADTGETQDDDPWADMTPEQLRAELAKERERSRKHQSHGTRQYQERQQLEKQLQDLQESLKRQQEIQEQQQLPPTDPRSPHYATVVEKDRIFRQFEDELREAQTEDERRFVARRYAGQLSENDIYHVRQFRQAREQQMQQLHEDPMRVFGPQIDQQVEARIRAYQERAAYQAEINELFAKNKDVVDAHRDQLVSLIQHGTPAPVAIDIVRGLTMQQKAASKVVEAERKASHAEAQKEQRRRQATQNRDAEGQPMDLPTLAEKICREEWGVDPQSGGNLMRALTEAKKRLGSG